MKLPPHVCIWAPPHISICLQCMSATKDPYTTECQPCSPALGCPASGVRATRCFDGFNLRGATCAAPSVRENGDSCFVVRARKRRPLIPSHSTLTLLADALLMMFPHACLQCIDIDPYCKACAVCPPGLCAGGLQCTQCTTGFFLKDGSCTAVRITAHCTAWQENRAALLSPFFLS